MTPVLFLAEATATPHGLPEVWPLVTKFAFFGGLALATGATVV